MCRRGGRLLIVRPPSPRPAESVLPTCLHLGQLCTYCFSLITTETKEDGICCPSSTLVPGRTIKNELDSSIRSIVCLVAGAAKVIVPSSLLGIENERSNER